MPVYLIYAAAPGAPPSGSAPAQGFPPSISAFSSRRAPQPPNLLSPAFSLAAGNTTP